MLVVSMCTPVVFPRSDSVDLLPCDIIPLGQSAIGELVALEEPVVTLSGLFSPEVFHRGRAVTDLDTRVTSTASVARITAFIVVIVVDDDGLTDDFFQTLIISIGFSAPLNHLLNTDGLDLLTCAMPVTESAEEGIVVRVRVPDPRKGGELRTSREWNIFGAAHSIAARFPGTSDNLIKIVLRNLGEHLLDCRPNLLWGFFVSCDSVVVQALPCKGFGHNTIVLPLSQLFSCEEGILEGMVV